MWLTEFLVKTVAGRVALSVVDFVSLYWEQVSAQAVGAVDQRKHRLALGAAYPLAETVRLIQVEGVPFRRFRQGFE